MKSIHLILLLFTISFFSCNKKTTKNEIDSIESIQKKQIENYDKTYADAGELIADFSINLKPNKKEIANWGNELIPWISIEHAPNEISRLVNPDEILIKQTSAKLIIDYPLNNPAIIEITNVNGFSRKDLILIISKKYIEIYNEEEASAKTKTIPLEQRTGLINRNQTDGKYGIWGHDISDLGLSGIELYQNKAGQITISLQIES
ncbi:hypothetical protein [Flavobacterium sp. I3-2]|uniref:hypothetical protein n=1 Tax=Flavobacterium sp. I3-2 TaxID=2748319 RepID=UPI0015AD5A9D|nr:hypothetical protein [Flavobacterium sp. I3-2]